MVQSQGGSLVLFFSFFYKGGSYLLGFRNMKMHLLIQICFYGKNINKLVIEFHFKIFKIIFIIIAISIYYPFSISGFGIDRYVRLGCIPQFFSSMSSLDSIDLQFIQAWRTRRHKVLKSQTRKLWSRMYQSWLRRKSTAASLLKTVYSFQYCSACLETFSDYHYCYKSLLNLHNLPWRQVNGFI